MEADDSSVYYESEYENIIEFDPLHKAMEGIKEDDRQLIQMHFIQEYSYREISRIKNRSVGAVIKRVNRSLEFMKSAMWTILKGMNFVLKEVPESMEELKRKATNQSNWRERLEAVNELKNYDCEQSRSILTN